MSSARRFQSPETAAALRQAIERASPDHPVRFMELCGAHTVLIARTGLKSFLPSNVEIVSGPGCPACVLDRATIDLAIAYARQRELIVLVPESVLRIPGSHGCLDDARRGGAKVRVVNKPIDVIATARREPRRTIVYLALGFEPAAPSVAALALTARREGIQNVTLLCALKLMPPAMVALVSSGNLRIDGFLCPGNVSEVIGAGAYRPLSEEYGRPCVVAGFEPIDLLLAVLMLVRQVREGRAEVESEYSHAVSDLGRARALALVDAVFEPRTVHWRSIGPIAGSGLFLRHFYQDLDVQRRFPLELPPETTRVAGTLCGRVLRGTASPPECPMLGLDCTPVAPRGSCMASPEGACSVHVRYGNGCGRAAAGTRATSRLRVDERHATWR